MFAITASIKLNSTSLSLVKYRESNIFKYSSGIAIFRTRVFFYIIYNTFTRAII